MRRILLTLAVLFIGSTCALAADYNWAATPTTSVTGRMGAAKAYTFTDNVAVSLSTMYVSGWSDDTEGGGHAPIGALVSVETQDARFSCGGGTPTTTGLGHLLASGSSFLFATVSAENCKFIPKTAGSYPLIQLTPIYSR